MDMMQGPTLLKYKNYRYFKATSALLAAAMAAYAVSDPSGGEAYGGTWLGYLLGIVSLLIVLVLTWYGVHKRHPPKVQDRRQYQKSDRRKREQGGAPTDLSIRRKTERRKHQARDTWRYGGTLQGWLSAHIYLGASLIVLASLHAGFQFGWNVHTLSYVLMLLVMASGFYGMYAYLSFPRQITRNMGEDTLEGMLLKVAELDELARVRALGLPDEVNALVLKARRETRIGGNLLQQLSGCQRDCPTAAAAQQVQQLGQKYIKDDQPKLMRDLYSVLLRKEKLVLRVRTEIMLKARMQCWLYVHAPLTIALLAALFAHIVAIYFYW
jgi:hypothetical protein